MAGVGGRFELEELRRQAQAEKKAARTRAIVSNATLVVVLLVVAIGGKIGWDKWQEKREADRIAAEEARIAEEKAVAERKKAEAERAKAAEEKREAERKAREAAEAAERKAREEKREAERIAREEERRRKEEERRFAEEHRVEQQELKKYEDLAVSNLRFQTGDHICYEYGVDEIVESSVDERRWLELSQLSQKRQTIEFLEQLRGDSVTNDFSDIRYPDRDTFAKLLENLDAERFTLVLRLKDDARGRRLALVAPDLEKGLAEPEGARQMKSGPRVIGWTVPFAYGDKMPVFLVEQSTADRFSREWSARRRKLRTEAAKLDNRDEYVSNRLSKELPGFVKSVKIEITTPPPEDKSAAKSSSSQKRESKQRQLMKGSNSNIRTLGGPKTLR